GGGGWWVTRLVVRLAPLWQATRWAPPGAAAPKMLRPRLGLPLWLGGAMGLRTLNAIQLVMSSCCSARWELAGPKLWTLGSESGVVPFPLLSVVVVVKPRPPKMLRVFCWWSGFSSRTGVQLRRR